MDEERGKQYITCRPEKLPKTVQSICFPPKQNNPNISGAVRTKDFLRLEIIAFAKCKIREALYIVFFLLNVLQHLLTDFWKQATYSNDPQDYLQKCGEQMGKCPPAIIGLLAWSRAPSYVVSFRTTMFEPTRKSQIATSEFDRAQASRGSSNSIDPAAPEIDTAEQ